MKAYIVVIEDRHVGIELQAYLSPERAINEARARAKELSRDETYEELELDDDSAMIFCAQYSYEGDFVSVYEAELVE